MMTNNEIQIAAEAYIAQETNEIFSGEISALLKSGDWDELSDRFWRELDFGTGGLRGVIGGGINRINPTVIRKATQGLANYIISHVAEDMTALPF